MFSLSRFLPEPARSPSLPVCLTLSHLAKAGEHFIPLPILPCAPSHGYGRLDVYLCVIIMEDKGKLPPSVFTFGSNTDSAQQQQRALHLPIVVVEQ